MALSGVALLEAEDLQLGLDLVEDRRHGCGFGVLSMCSVPSWLCLNVAQSVKSLLAIVLLWCFI